MKRLPEAQTTPTSRIRRWDAVVLGSSLPGLVAAVRLGMHGGRVLVLEEKTAGARPDCLREPWWTSGVEKGSVFGACLRELRVPLIDQRRIEPDPLAFQVVLPDVRLDVGEGDSGFLDQKPVPSQRDPGARQYSWRRQRDRAA